MFVVPSRDVPPEGKLQIRMRFNEMTMPSAAVSEYGVMPLTTRLYHNWFMNSFPTAILIFEKRSCTAANTECVTVGTTLHRPDIYNLTTSVGDVILKHCMTAPKCS